MLEIIRRQNYVILLLALLSLVIGLSLLSFLMAAWIPGIIGSPPVSGEIRDIYSFEPWDLALNGLEVSFPNGGAMAPVYVNEEIRGALFQGRGELRYANNGLPPVSESFLIISAGAQFDIINYDITFSRMDDEKLKYELQTLLARLQVPPVLLENAIPLSFDIPAGTYYCYFFDPDITYLPVIVNSKPMTPWLAALLYALLLTIIFLLIAMLSLDHKTTAPGNEFLAARPSRNMFLALALGILLAGITEFTVQAKELSAWLASSGYIPGLALFLYISGEERDFFLRLQRKTWKQGFPLAIIGAFLLISLPLQLPRAVEGLFSINALAHFLLVFLSIGLVKELFWRGFLQSTLVRIAGPAAGIALTGILGGTGHLLITALSNPSIFGYPYIYVELAVLVPGISMIIGYVYYKTSNILSCALLHTLLLVLPSYLVY